MRLNYFPFSELERVRMLECDKVAKAALFADMCRINLLYMIMRAGSGHVGTSLSCIDIVSWLFLEGMGTQDRYFSSKGHDAPALYSVLIGMGMLDFDMLHKLRRIGGLPGHPDIGTPHMVTNTGSLGMGISKAKGMVLANRLQNRTGRVFVLTGDGELQEGQFWESLISAVNLRMGEITVIVDHNKIQSDTWVSETSGLGDLESKFEAFGMRVHRCNGNDMGTLSTELVKIYKADQPQVLIADTLKGSGVSFMEHPAVMRTENIYNYHSGAPSNSDYREAVGELLGRLERRLADLGEKMVAVETASAEETSSTPVVQRLIPAYSEELIEQADTHDEIVALDGDLILDTGLIPFRERFPERFFECGIAEQDMVSQAGGLALSGVFPVVHSFACFLSDRPNEQIYNNATEKTKIMYVGSLAGIIPGGPGHSHQCVRDISALGGIPALTMIEPCNETETRMAVKYCVEETRDSTYLRLTSIPVEIPYDLPSQYKLTYGRGGILREGTDAVLIGYGPSLLSQAFAAAEYLENDGLSLAIVNLPWLNRVDHEWLGETLSGFSYVFTLDNHYVVGGQGDMLLSAIAELNFERSLNVKKLGVREIPVCGTNGEVLEHHRLDATGLAEDIDNFVKAKR